MHQIKRQYGACVDNQLANEILTPKRVLKSFAAFDSARIRFRHLQPDVYESFPDGTKASRLDHRPSAWLRPAWLTLSCAVRVLCALIEAGCRSYSEIGAESPSLVEWSGTPGE